ncbi:hypothetical protein CBR_g4653 [Chara braunii]|uniref:RRM domain-containing protein n=1 Tax=Chara braunii TaxID=69332 RepID=A0A388KIE5_CHABU|nr:hypothetical protein CBR_g4653 [Chara braunii]|eukprot:GBG69824.1 hypothetical protein CBR_g4653 [Chara braunii]
MGLKWLCATPVQTLQQFNLPTVTVGRGRGVTISQNLGSRSSLRLSGIHPGMGGSLASAQAGAVGRGAAAGDGGFVGERQSLDDLSIGEGTSRMLPDVNSSCNGTTSGGVPDSPDHYDPDQPLWTEARSCLSERGSAGVNLCSPDSSRWVVGLTKGVRGGSRHLPLPLGGGVGSVSIAKDVGGVSRSSWRVTGMGGRHVLQTKSGNGWGCDSGHLDSEVLSGVQGRLEGGGMRESGMGRGVKRGRHDLDGVEEGCVLHRPGTWNRPWSSCSGGSRDNRDGAAPAVADLHLMSATDPNPYLSGRGRGSLVRSFDGGRLEQQQQRGSAGKAEEMGNFGPRHSEEMGEFANNWMARSGQGYVPGTSRVCHAKKHAEKQATKTLGLFNIPQELNTLETILNHFRKFGKVVDVRCQHDGSRAFLQFARTEDAKTALHAPEAVMGNRFIKLTWAKRDSIPTADKRANTFAPELNYGQGTRASPSAPPLSIQKERTEKKAETSSEPGAAAGGCCGAPSAHSMPSTMAALSLSTGGRVGAVLNLQKQDGATVFGGSAWTLATGSASGSAGASSGCDGAPSAHSMPSTVRRVGAILNLHKQDGATVFGGSAWTSATGSASGSAGALPTMMPVNASGDKSFPSDQQKQKGNLELLMDIQKKQEVLLRMQIQQRKLIVERLAKRAQERERGRNAAITELEGACAPVDVSSKEDECEASEGEAPNSATQTTVGASTSKTGMSQSLITNSAAVVAKNEETQRSIEDWMIAHCDMMKSEEWNNIVKALMNAHESFKYAKNEKARTTCVEVTKGRVATRVEETAAAVAFHWLLAATGRLDLSPLEATHQHYAWKESIVLTTHRHLFRAATERILDNTLWSGVEKVMETSKGLLDLLKFVDGNGPTISKIYGRMDNLVEKLRENEVLTETEKDELEVINHNATLECHDITTALCSNVFGP